MSKVIAPERFEFDGHESSLCRACSVCRGAGVVEDCDQDGAYSAPCSACEHTGCHCGEVAVKLADMERWLTEQQRIYAEARAELQALKDDIGF